MRLPIVYGGVARHGHSIQCQSDHNLKTEVSVRRERRNANKTNLPRSILSVQPLYLTLTLTSSIHHNVFANHVAFVFVLPSRSLHSRLVRGINRLQRTHTCYGHRLRTLRIHICVYECIEVRKELLIDNFLSSLSNLRSDLSANKQMTCTVYTYPNCTAASGSVINQFHVWVSAFGTQFIW